VTPRFLPESGGVETHVHEVGRRLVRRGVALRVLTTDRTGALRREELVDGIPVTRVAAHPRRSDLYLAPALPQALGRMPADLVHVQSYHTLVAPVAMLAALGKRVPYIVTFHSGGHSSPSRRRMRGPQAAVLAPLLGRAVHLVAVSAFEADQFSRSLRLPRDRIEVVPNGTELPKLPPAPPVAGLVVSVGRLEHYKGHHRVIEALPILARSVPDARLRIVGHGPYEAELRRLAAALGVADRVEIGAVPAGDRVAMARVLQSAGVVAVLSEYESHGLAALEAAAAGRPVVVTAGSALRELADAGIAVPAPPDGGPEVIASLLEDQLRRPTPGQAAQLPSWEGCAERLLEIYRHAISGPTCAS
jgi:glycosyltransferase involved in cell wall biosynthesis